MKTEERSRHTVWMDDSVWQRVQEQYKRNGNLLFTIRPIQAALQQDYDRQLQKLTEDAARRRYADFIENTG